MNPTPESIAEVIQRLDAISLTLEKLSADNAEVQRTYLESNEKYLLALRTSQESDERYRKELEAYSVERRSKELAVSIGAVLRIAAVVLLAYIAFKVS